MLDKKWILTEDEYHTWIWVWNIRVDLLGKNFLEYFLETEKAEEL